MDGKYFVSRRSRRSLLGSVLLGRSDFQRSPQKEGDLPKFSNQFPNKSGLFKLIHLTSRLIAASDGVADEHLRHRFVSSFLQAETKSLKYRVRA